MLQHTHVLIVKISFFLFLQFKPVVKNQEEEQSQNKGSKKKTDKKGANKLGAAQAAS